MSNNGSYLKLNSEYSGNYTVGNNRVLFILRQGDYDLSKAVVELFVQLSATELTNAVHARYADSGNGVYEMELDAFVNDVNRPELHNVCLIKNANLTSSTKGSLERLLRVDVLRTNLMYYLKTSSELYSMKKDMLASNADRSEIFRTPLVRKYRYGSESAEYLEVPLLVKLSDIFELGDLQWAGDELGDCSIELELNVDKVSIRHQDGLPTVSPFPADSPISIQEFQVVNRSVVGADEPVNSLTISAPLVSERFEVFPYYVGMKVRIQANVNDNSPAIVRTVDVARTITNISDMNALDNNRITLTFNSPITTLLNASNETTLSQKDGTVIEKVQPATGAITFTRAEMLVFKSDVPYKLAPGFTYRTFTTEEYNTGVGVSELKRVFDVEPECNNLFVMFPDAGGLISSNHHLVNYRLAYDNNDLNTQDVEFGNTLTVQNRDVLYYDNLLKAVIKSNDTVGQKILSNLNESVGYQNFVRHSVNEETPTSKLSMIATPLPYTPRQKLVQLNVVASGNHIDKVVLFKQIQKRQLN